MKAFGRWSGLSDSNKILIAFAVASIVVVGVASAQTTDTVTVDVSIASLTQITVIPTSLNFSQTPGATGSMIGVDVQNTGSLNVSQLHVYMNTLTTENVRPYGSPTSTSYAAGGLIVIRNETNNTFYWVGRLEWNESNFPSNMIVTGVTSPVSWGFVRNASREYNWLVGNGTPSIGANFAMCNGTGSQFAIEEDIDNGTSGSRTPTATSITRDGGDANYGYFSVGDSRRALANSCVAIDTNCTKLYIYAYDKRSGFSTCANSKHLQFSNLVPGQTHKTNITAYFPYGIPNNPGTLNTSTMTFEAT